jgi:class 3 adenylate cyclase/tetratricopeptide (TPR) repeat protein
MLIRERSGAAMDSGMADQQQLERAIAAQETLRGMVADEMVDVAVAALRQQLERLQAAAPRRRQVTVLFADVSGFTAMSEKLDAELVAATMNEIWARLDVVITDHGGRIDKHIGDAIMAVWGAESTHEDDPERAVRAGLALQEQLASFAAEAGVDVAMRVGINTGRAHLGTVGTTAEATVMGDTVNLASRLEHLAPIGGVLISHDTYRTVRGLFDVQPRGEVEVRGKRDAVRVYEVRRAKPRSFRQATRGVEGVETRTIGRDRELRLLQALFTDVVEGMGATLVTVVAEAGAGKSRLLYEFLNWVELAPSEVYLFTGRALANRQGAALGVFRDVIATRFEIHDGDPADEVARKLRAGFGQHLSADEADVVGHWLGFELSSSPAVQRLLGAQFAETARAQLLGFFASLATSDPVVLALEDLHWADDESLDLLVELVAHLAEHRVMALGLTRPTLLDGRPDFPGDGIRCTRLDLASLSDADSRDLVHEVLQRVEEVPDDLVDLVVSRADGNAFYIEELIKMLIDNDVVDTSPADDTWRVDLARLDPSDVPSTLTGVLQARLDALQADERRTLQCAAIVGRVFWDAAVSAVYRGADATSTGLDLARRRELVFRRETTTFANTEEYLFKHALLCDVTYETVLLSERRVLHGLVAGWLEAAAGERVAEHREMIAGHLRAAGEPAKAAEHLWRAGESLLATGVAAGAARSLRTAVDLWDSVGVAPPFDALLLLAEAALRIDDVAGADAAVRRAEPRAATRVERADVLHFASWIASNRGQHDLERSLLDEALPLAEEAGGRTLSRLLLGRVWLESQAGDLEVAERNAQRALELAEAIGDLGEICRALRSLAMVASERGDLAASQGFANVELAVAEQSGNLAEQARALDTLGVVIHLRGDADGNLEHYRSAIAHYRRAIELHYRLGARLYATKISLNMAQAYVRVGRDREAATLIRESLAAARDLSSSWAQAMCVQMEADRRLANGEAQIGLAYLGLFLRLPSTGSIDEGECDRILARTSLTAEAIEQGMAAGANLDLDSVVQDILAGETTPARPEAQR